MLITLRHGDVVVVAIAAGVLSLVVRSIPTRIYFVVLALAVAAVLVHVGVGGGTTGERSLMTQSSMSCPTTPQGSRTGIRSGMTLFIDELPRGTPALAAEVLQPQNDVGTRGFERKDHE